MRADHRRRPCWSASPPPASSPDPPSWRSIPPPEARIETPARVHLLDGSVVVYPDGFTIRGDTVQGRGSRYDLTLQFAGTATRLPADSVAAMESFRLETDAGRSALGTLGVVGGVVLAISLWVDMAFSSGLGL